MEDALPVPFLNCEIFVLESHTGDVYVEKCKNGSKKCDFFL